MTLEETPQTAPEPREGLLSRMTRRRKRLLGGALAALAAAAWLRLGPLPEGFLDPAPHRSIRVVDRRGDLLYESLSDREARSVWLPPDALPEPLLAATLAAEDHRFFGHVGLDPIALARAAWRDLRAMRIVEGGSTLTQQAVKQLTRRRRTPSGKLREMVYALRLEHRLKKREILALYLNLAPYGNQFVGAEAAARGYFGCPAASLTPAQAALLAGLPKRPSGWNPYRNLEGAQRRQREVLRRMRERGFLDEETYHQALGERLVFRHESRAFEAPHFVLRVLAEGPQGEGAETVKTTLDGGLQRQVQGILKALEGHFSACGASATAVVVVHVPTGEVLAYEGSGAYYDAERSGAVDGAATPRQPGSALKPFAYALAFERGFTPASVLPDLPRHFATAEAGVSYSPRNYDGVFRGPLRARKALAGSVNVPAVWLLSQVGVADFLSLLQAAGLHGLNRTADYYGYGLVLGDAEVRLDETVCAYAALARGGLFLPLRSRLDGEAAVEPVRLLSPRAAAWVTDILSDAEARAFVFGRGGSLEFPFPVAAKTGTSQAYRDNWAFGYTREVAVGVWVGNFDGRPLTGSSGVAGAGPLFHEVMLAAEKSVLGRNPGPGDPPLATPPEGSAPRTLCALSGAQAGVGCRSTVVEWLPSEPPLPPCDWHSPEGELLWPAAYAEWAGRQGRPSRVRSPRTEAAPAAGEERPARRGPAAPTFSLVNPPPDAIYLLDPTLRNEFQALPLRVSAAGPAREIVWRVDGAEIGRARSDRPFTWPLSPGEHRIEACDASGNRVETRILVK